MKHLQRWTICLDNSANDEIILEHTARMARFFRPAYIQVLHVMEGEEVPDILLKEYTDLHKPEMEYYLNRMEGKRKAFLGDFPNAGVKIRQGNKLREILSGIFDTETDLVIMGRGARKGTIMKKVVRKSGASVLMIPDKTNTALEHVLVSTDFSAHATRALQIGSGLATGLEIPKVTALHVYHDATKYVSQAVETPFEVDQLLHQRTLINEKLQAYTRIKLAEQVAQAIPASKVDQLVIPSPSGVKKSETLVQWVKESDADVLVLGARGQSPAESFFLGSFAEDVYTRLPNQVILLYKEQGENAGFLKLLLGKGK